MTKLVSSNNGVFSKCLKLLLLLVLINGSSKVFSSVFELSSSEHRALAVMHKLMNLIEGDREWNPIFYHMNNLEKIAKDAVIKSSDEPSASLVRLLRAPLVQHWGVLSQSSNERGVLSQYSQPYADIKIPNGSEFLEWVVSIKVAALAFIPRFLQNNRESISKEDARVLLTILSTLYKSLETDAKWRLEIIKARFKHSATRVSQDAKTPYERACRYILMEQIRNDLSSLSEGLLDKVLKIENDEWKAQGPLELTNTFSPEFRTLDIVGNQARALDGVFSGNEPSAGFVDSLQSVFAGCADQFGLYAQTR